MTVQTILRLRDALIKHLEAENAAYYNPKNRDDLVTQAQALNTLRRDIKALEAQLICK